MEKNSLSFIRGFLLAVFCGLALQGAMTFAGIPTTDLGLSKWEVGDTDYVEQYSATLETLDDSVLDKRTGGTISGDLTVTGSIISTNTFSISGFEIQGSTDNTGIKASICAGGLGACMIISTDEGDIYVSTGTGIGAYRNSRTGKAP